MKALAHDRSGPKRVYVVALLAFADASILSGQVWDLPSMVLFRILHAVPGGVLPVVTLAMVYWIMPPRRSAPPWAPSDSAWSWPRLSGRTLGGYLVERADWRFNFFLNAPIALLGAFLAAGCSAKCRGRQPLASTHGASPRRRTGTGPVRQTRLHLSRNIDIHSIRIWLRDPVP